MPKFPRGNIRRQRRTSSDGWRFPPGKHVLNVRMARPPKDAIVMVDDSARKFRQDHTADVARARIYTDATTSPEKGRGLCPSAGQAEPMHRATRAYLPASKASPCPHPHGSSEAPPTPSPRHRSRPQHLALSSVRSMLCRFRHGRHRRAHPKDAPAPPFPRRMCFPGETSSSPSPPRHVVRLKARPHRARHPQAAAAIRTGRSRPDDPPMPLSRGSGRTMTRPSALQLHPARTTPGARATPYRHAARHVSPGKPSRRVSPGKHGVRQ
ncbi:hypothetical protein BW41_01871 [Sphingomonas sp. RIT328]|nr:hypothetical protein BW41_01820 [Sphingomonas sp. RIT328]EZP53730.1 hypothetical protein BW41_01871 [Sphingomonas sp. RIT328]